MKLFRWIKESKSRIKQDLGQKTGIYQGTDDSDFQAENAEYENIVDSGRHMQATARAHILAAKKFCQTGSAFSVQLAAFHRGTPVANGAMALGQAHAEIERVPLAAVERLFEEEVIAAIDQILWQVPEVHEKVKLRRKQLLYRNAQQRKYEAAEAALASFNENQNHGSNSSGGLFRRAKSEAELSAEVATRKVKLEHANTAFDDTTQWCRTQFRSLLDQREAGNVLGGPMAAFFACQRMLLGAGAEKLDQVVRHLPAAQKHEETLVVYESDFAKSAPGDGPFDPIPEYSREVPGAFGAPLPDMCPPVITEAIEFLQSHMETVGIFRIPGNEDRVLEARERYNAGETNVFEAMNCDPHDVASTIKRYLRDLPESLIPQDFYELLIDAGTADDDAEALADVVGQLPYAHFKTLSPLLMLLYRIARRSSTNEMTFLSLASCVAPSFVRAPADLLSESISHLSVINKSIKTLIEHAKRFDESNSIPVEHTQASRIHSVAYASSSHLPPMAPSTRQPLMPQAPLPPQGGNRHMSRRFGSSQGSDRARSGVFGSRRMSMRKDSSTALAAGMF